MPEFKVVATLEADTSEEAVAAYVHDALLSMGDFYHSQSPFFSMAGRVKIVSVNDKPVTINLED